MFPEGVRSCRALSTFSYSVLFSSQGHKRIADCEISGVSSQRLMVSSLPLSSSNTLLFVFLHRLWIRTICCRMRGPTTSLHRFSRRTCTPPHTTPQRWANTTTDQTPRRLLAEPITTAETRVPSVALSPWWQGRSGHLLKPSTFPTHTLCTRRGARSNIPADFFPKISPLEDRVT